MSACVRECFARVGVMYPELRARLAEWLAYHLSNFQYVWPWEKWAQVLEAPLHDGQRYAHRRNAPLRVYCYKPQILDPTSCRRLTSRPASGWIAECDVRSLIGCHTRDPPFQ
jgi:MIF4G like